MTKVTKLYAVYEMDGTYPQSVTTPGTVFSSLEDAQVYTDAQYEAQSSTPYYPAKWWYTSTVNFAEVPVEVTGYPTPTGTTPHTPTGVTVTPGSDSFTVAWTPNSPAGPEVYVVSAYIDEFYVNGGGYPSGFIFPIYSQEVDSGTSAALSATAIPVPGLNNFPQPGEAFPFGIPLSFTVKAVNAFGSSAETTPTSAVTIYGSTPVPAAPANAIVTLTTPGTPFNTYTLTWDQPYPSGAGTPTHWRVGNFNGNARTTGGISITTNWVDEITTGAPTTGSFQFQASSTNLGLAMANGGFGNIYAYNSAGASAASNHVTAVS